MKSSKLISLISTFSAGELREFRDFVASPYYNKNQELVLFYTFLKDMAPRFPSKKLKRETAYKSLFPEREFDNKHLNYLMSFLLKLAEQFIGLKKYESEQALNQYHVLEACIDRHLDKNYIGIAKKMTQEVSDYPYRDAAFYYHKYLLADAENHHFGQQNVRKFNPYLQQAADHFDLYFLGQKLKYTCEMLNSKKFLSADYQLKMTGEIQDYLAQHPHQEVPVIAVYHTILLTLTDESNTRHFYALKELLDRHFHLFPASEMKELHIHAINYCIRKIRQKEELFVQEALDLYMKGIDTGLLLDGPYLSPWTYTNIIKLGLRLKKYDWTEATIQKYHTSLEEHFRSDALNYSLADLYYHKQDIEKAMLYLREVEFSDVFFALDAKVMLLKIYYDDQEEEALYSLLISFRAFLNRNRLISDSMRKTYLNFITFLSTIMKAEQNSWLEIEEEIRNCELLAERQWLLSLLAR